MKKLLFSLLILFLSMFIFGVIIILTSILIIFNFFENDFGHDEYIEGNIEYAEMYIEVLNKNITENNNGYIPLSRILYFYNDNPTLSFESIYSNNIDINEKSMKPISDVCNEYYKNVFICTKENISNSKQVDTYIFKPFNMPLDFNESKITSYFGKERYVFEKFDIHYAWDFSAKEKTNVYSIGNGVVTNVRFNQDTNISDTTNGLGNFIEIEYLIQEKKYTTIFAHLFPNSNTVNIGDTVTHWQKIAEVGTTGYSEGNHLHFQITLNSQLIDGMNLIDFTHEKEMYINN